MTIRSSGDAEAVARPRQPLTARQQELFAFICRYKAEHDGNSPAIREICRGLHLAATSSAYLHLKGLAAKGWITVEYKLTRSICVIGAKWTPPAEAAPVAEGG